ncbi:DsbA family protein [Kibdelosporangium phytohabitans]|uniref:Thioredoxin-like fold domain-containing protein n=1 Tax=Kibdelosporangium phytohabitans TaxID=860235 RepID=A0A0N9HNR6_9PSEU|nr:thioredoxin domain-containing protein [Kibdelosporangium phytohabitans]ALG08645.1 hypothetical protein AOZ06_18515 [Kibdelosporangium phytohabitans]MBE1470257.1 protein-disulfide isomerase [Kibdelosporangium phytohabitans]
MSKNAKVSLTIVAVAVLVVGLLLLVNRPGDPIAARQRDGAPAAELVRPDSHRLSPAPDGKGTVVEFLDLECEACGAAFPGVEQLCAEYSGKVTFIVRYFPIPIPIPIPSHRNAELAARAVEAAARQGKLEPMYG